MFLSGTDIRERLAKGDLLIEPLPEEDQLAGFTVDLRLGTQFAFLPGIRSQNTIDITASAGIALSQEPFERKTVPLGDSLVVFPGVSLVAITLEYLHMPPDLGGLLFPTSSWERHGLSVASGTVDPGFQGKLTLALRNVGTMPVVLYPGLRITRLCLSQLTSSTEFRLPYKHVISNEAEVQRVKVALQRAAPPVAQAAASPQAMAKHLAEVLATRGAKKGKALEELMVEVFSSLQGLRVIKRNARLRAEEIDLLVANDLTIGFLRLAGSPLVVECKNWADKVGAREVTVLLDKLRTVGPDARTGVLVALNGVTGEFRRDAVLKIREARQAGRFVIVLERADLENLAAGTPLGEILERKYEALLLI